MIEKGLSKTRGNNGEISCGVFDTFLYKHLLSPSMNASLPFLSLSHALSKN